MSQLSIPHSSLQGGGGISVQAGSQGGATGGGGSTNMSADGAVSLDGHITHSSTAGAAAATGGQPNSQTRLCPLCWHNLSSDLFPLLRNCAHLFCINCLQTYVRIEIQEGRVNLKCPQCSESMHPNGRNDQDEIICQKNSSRTFKRQSH